METDVQGHATHWGRAQDHSSDLDSLFQVVSIVQLACLSLPTIWNSWEGTLRGFLSSMPVVTGAYAEFLRDGS